MLVGRVWHGVSGVLLYSPCFVINVLASLGAHYMYLGCSLSTMRAALRA